MSVRTEPRQTGGESGPGASAAAGESEQGDTVALSDSEIFDILRNSRRRSVISLLREKGELSVPALTRYVAAEEYGIDMEELSPEQHKRVYTGLYQCHLPRLDEAGVVAFDKDAKTVALQDGSTQVERYLDRGEDPTAARVEIAAALVVAGVVALGTAGVGPLASVPPIGWAITTVVALTGFALFQLARARAAT